MQWSIIPIKNLTSLFPLIFLSKHICVYALGRIKWIIGIIWPWNQHFNLKNQRNWKKQVWMLNFLIGIICILLHWWKKLTLVIVEPKELNKTCFWNMLKKQTLKFKNWINIVLSLLNRFEVHQSSFLREKFLGLILWSFFDPIFWSFFAKSSGTSGNPKQNCPKSPFSHDVFWNSHVSLPRSLRSKDVWGWVLRLWHQIDFCYPANTDITVESGNSKLDVDSMILVS